MNFLNIRKGPDMNFIIGEHRNEFEQHVIDLYMGTNEGFWGCVPSLERSIMPHVNPKFLYAGFLGEASEDPSFYVKETHGKFINSEFEQIWCAANLAKLEAENEDYMHFTYIHTMADVGNVLDFHNMFFALAVGATTDGKIAQGFANYPLIEVW